MTQPWIKPINMSYDMRSKQHSFRAEAWSDALRLHFSIPESMKSKHTVVDTYCRRSKLLQLRFRAEALTRRFAIASQRTEIHNMLWHSLKRSLKVPVHAISGECPSAVPRSPGPGPLLEGVKNLIICFCGILPASGRRAIRSLTEMCG